MARLVNADRHAPHLTRDIVLTLVLAAVQVLSLRVTQYALPALYFTTSSLFDRRSEVRGGAILFRLAIPLASGMLVPILQPHNARAVAAGAGVIAWFLVLWPIAWAPSLLLPRSRAWPISALLFVTWVAFGLLPIAGVALTELAQDLFRDPHSGWSHAVLEAVFAGLPVTTGTWILGQLAQRRVSFADDDEDVPAEELEEAPSTPSLSERLQSVSYSVPEGIVSLATLAVLILILLRANRYRRV
jgi:hypothetical protein